MRLQALKAKAADLLGQMQAASLAAEGRAMTADERTAFDALVGDHTAVCGDIARETQMQSTLRAAETGRVHADQHAAAAADAEAGLPIVEMGRDLKAIGDTKKPGFFGRQLQAVKHYAANGGWGQIAADERALLAPMLAGPTGLNTDVPSDGGFLVASERSSTVLQRIYDIGAIASRVFRAPIGPGSNGMKIPAIDETSRADGSRYGGIASGWLGQGNTLAAGKPKFRELDLKLRKVGAFVYATDEQLADAIALEGWINRYLPLELQFRVENAIVNGVGGNQPLGILNSGCVITVTRSIASQVLSDDMQAMLARLWAPLRSRAVFLVDQSVEPFLWKLGIAVGTGGVLDPNYRPAGSVPGQPYATYMGVPIIPVEHCAALGTTGDIILTCFDEYTLIDKGAVEQAVSIHVAFLTDESVFRFIYRVDGQCNWQAALTPKSGGNTLSCCVVLS